MNDAILNGESFSKNQIHNEEPMKINHYQVSICSYLGKPKIDFNSHNKWPKKGNPVRFISKDLSMQGMKPHGVS